MRFDKGTNSYKHLIMNRIFIIIIVLISALLSSVPVMAAPFPQLEKYNYTPGIEQPTSITIVSVFAASSTISSGDISIVFLYNIAYSEYPSEPASDAFILRLYSAGDQLLASSTPYVKYDNGYGYGVGSFYFTNDEAPLWESALNLQIVGNPAAFDTLPTPYQYTMTDSDYAEGTTKAENQEEMCEYILEICEQLSSAHSVSFSGITDSGYVLTTLGENYFMNAVPGIMSMAPDIFYIQAHIPTEIELTYSNDLAVEYSEKLEGYDIMVGFQRIGDLMGVPGQTAAAFIMVIISIALIVFLTYKGWPVEPGLIGAGIIMSGGAIILGDAVLGIRIVMGFIAGILIMYTLFLKKA
jgi:hypothetical protein